jgi:hypothetical protein
MVLVELAVHTTMQQPLWVEQMLGMVDLKMLAPQLRLQTVAAAVEVVEMVLPKLMPLELQVQLESSSFDTQCQQLQSQHQRLG